MCILHHIAYKLNINTRNTTEKKNTDGEIPSINPLQTQFPGLSQVPKASHIIQIIAPKCAFAQICCARVMRQLHIWRAPFEKRMTCTVAHKCKDSLVVICLTSVILKFGLLKWRMWFWMDGYWGDGNGSILFSGIL